MDTWHRSRDASRRPRHRRWSSLLVALAVLVPLLGVVLPVGTVTAAGGLTPVAGVEAFGIGAGQIATPGPVAVNAQGDLFIVDSPNHRVLRYAYDAAADSYAKVGVAVAGGTGAGAGANQLNLPADIALDAAGNLLVADAGNNRVQKVAYDSATGTFASIAMTVVSGAGGDVALDAAGNMFVSDTTNKRVLKFAYDAGAGSYASSGTVAAAATRGNIAFSPSGDLFVADRDSVRVLRFAFDAASGSFASTPTFASEQVAIPQAIAFDAQGNLYVSYNYLGVGAVRKYAYNPATGAFAAAGVNAAGVSGTGPTGIAFDVAGRLFVGHTQYTFNPNSTVWNVVLRYTFDASSQSFVPGGTIMGQQGRVNQGITSIAVDSGRDLFVGNSLDNRVYRFAFVASTSTYSVLSTVAAGSGGQGSGANQLSDPAGVALNSSGDLFVADQGNSRVILYRRDAGTGTYPANGVSVPGATQLAHLAVQDLAVDSKNNLFVGAGNQVLEFAYDSSSATYAATGTVVATVTVGAAPQGQALGLGLDTADNLFVAEANAGRVVEYLVNPTTGTYPASGVVVAGVGGSGSAANQLNLPIDAAIALDGTLYVFDSNNSRIMQFVGNSSTGTYSSSGSIVFSEGRTNWPERGGVAVDAAGNLFFNSNLVRATVYEVAAGSVPPPPPPPPAAPTVTGIAPTFGSTAGGTVVTITGTNLSGGSVKFGNNTATASACAASSCTATSPSGSGTVDVKVTTTSGTSATVAVDKFTYQAPPLPAVTGITPASGPTAGGTVVAITGTNLGGGSVKFGSKSATAVNCTPTSCTATSPAGSGTVDVKVTTSAGSSPTIAADRFTYQVAQPPPPPPPPGGNLVPNSGFESAGVPADYWGGQVARTAAVAHSGGYALAQTTSSASGGWDLDANTAWYTPVTSTKTYTASVWVRASKTTKVVLNVDLLNSSGGYVNTADGTKVTLVVDTWTQLTLTFQPANGQVFAAPEPNFSNATSGTVITWDDMSITPD